MSSEWLGDYETEKELDNCDARSELPHAPAGIWALPAVPLRPSRARSPLAASAGKGNAGGGKMLAESRRNQELLLRSCDVKE